MIHLPDGRPIKNPKSLIRRYVKEYAYNLYDCRGALRSCDDPNTLTDRQRKAVNGGMSARSPRAFWDCWGNCALDALRRIPTNLDLIDGGDAEVKDGIDAVRELVCRMADMHQVGDVAPTKALHLLRPRFIAVSDYYVRASLGIHDPSYKPAKNVWYAERAAAVQWAVRSLGRENKPTLDELHVWANNLRAVTTELSKVRILDIVVWLDAVRKSAEVGSASL